MILKRNAILPLDGQLFFNLVGVLIASNINQTINFAKRERAAKERLRNSKASKRGFLNNIKEAFFLKSHNPITSYV